MLQEDIPYLHYIDVLMPCFYIKMLYRYIDVLMHYTIHYGQNRVSTYTSG